MELIKTDTQPTLTWPMALIGFSIGVYYYAFKLAIPYIKIKEYKTKPRIQNPRKWRRILRRKKQFKKINT